MTRTIPPVAIIESALESVARPAWGHDPSKHIDRKKILEEFRALGDARLAKLAGTLEAQTDLERGYLLGLETAKWILATMPAAITAKVEL